MTPLAWGLLIAIVVVVLIAIAFAISAHTRKEQEALERRQQQSKCRSRFAGPESIFMIQSQQNMPKGIDGNFGLGAPIFDDGIKKRPCTLLTPGSVVWCPTPIGVLRGIVTSSESIDCGDHKVKPRRVPEYFSREMAQKLSVSRLVWVVDDIREPSSSIGYKMGHRSGITPNPRARMQGVAWIRDESFFCDFLDIMIEELWFELMFCLFDQPVEYYEDLEAVFVDGERSGGLETFISSEVATPEAEANFEDVVSQVDDAAEQTFVGSESEPTRHEAPEPAPAPEPVSRYEPPASTPAYDSPSESYSGGDSGGGDSGGGDSGGGD